jgi:hypothetical protein|tara:strand:- start:2563 stop:3240 length:678 start_codon:yes stop_codon:yes gene_type:complete
MLFPTYVADNFFDDPKKVIDFASTCDFSQDPNGAWPGKRSCNLSKINYNLFEFVTNKILRLIFPDTITNLIWHAESYFQYIDYGEGSKEAWIHKDNGSELSSIIYLSRHKECGTSIYRPKFFHKSLDPNLDKLKKSYYINNKKFDKFYFNALKKNNSKFEKTIEINSCFNRMLAFDAHQWHSANGFFDKDIKQGRLTLVTFITNISRNDCKRLRFPIAEMKRTIG